jgi:hypothetical protein
MRVVALVTFAFTVLVGGFFVLEDDCATACAAAAAADKTELAALDHGDEHDEADCADDTCPEKDNGCDDCETCTCCASTAPGATVTAVASGQPPLPQIDDDGSATGPELRASAGFLPGVFKPPRA